jgi:hypothetical protein
MLSLQEILEIFLPEGEKPQIRTKKTVFLPLAKQFHTFKPAILQNAVIC